MGSGNESLISRDPVGYVDGMNMYEYARSAPMRYADPAGTDIVEYGCHFHLVGDSLDLIPSLEDKECNKCKEGWTRSLQWEGVSKSVLVGDGKFLNSPHVSSGCKLEGVLDAIRHVLNQHQVVEDIIGSYQNWSTMFNSLVSTSHALAVWVKEERGVLITDMYRCERRGWLFRKYEWKRISHVESRKGVGVWKLWTAVWSPSVATLKEEAEKYLKELAEEWIEDCGKEK